ncbi:MAG: cysteine methyltransferase [Planctomycetes bacterium HGW-Planctomycetes-1]|nr:MAG: cysteine methyltransferase [Planctomycetes bacterium HGW-Planctomycetes-1]
MGKNSTKYVIFKTRWGVFGLLADYKGILRTVLPMSSFEIAKRYLLVGMFQETKQDLNLCPAMQKDIRAYYNGSYVDFKKAQFGLNGEKLTDFSKKVLNVCIKIPFGQTITYSQLAKQAGFPNAARAVGSVLAKNQLPLLVPCHRVIRGDGKIGNFSAAGGSKTKKKMLEFEKEIIGYRG